MKLLIAICALAVSFTTYSSCSEDFNKGISQFENAMNYFEDGSQSFQRALDESRGQGRRSVICGALLKSNTGFDVATRTFNSCIDSFTKASNSCSGESRTIALENKGVCVGNHDVAKGNYEQVLSTLKATCFKASESVDIDLNGTIQEL
ncbi:hypothetical protein [Halobacteriovorax sp.]|uniref:hypothetical protein n=1 Tax=Halobacteriovorax sp. TaxID=2020862 RepID=UPI0035631553